MERERRRQGCCMKCFECENKDGKQGDVVGPEYMLRGRRGVGIHDRVLRARRSQWDAFYIISPHTGIENAQTYCITLFSKSNSHIASEVVLSFARVQSKNARSREHLKRSLYHQKKPKRTNLLRILFLFQRLIMTSSSQTKITIFSKSLVIPLLSCDI